jgi:hypothetical protein
MPLTNPSRIPLAQEFVRLGFGDTIDSACPFRSLEFLTEALTTVEAQQVIPVVKRFNAFDGEAVATAIARFRGRVMGWKFGCAGSPLLIVQLAPWTHQIEDTPPGGKSGRQHTDKENQKLLTELRDLFLLQLKADKFEMNGDVDYEYGAWWD